MLLDVRLKYDFISTKKNVPSRSPRRVKELFEVNQIAVFEVISLHRGEVLISIIYWLIKRIRAQCWLLNCFSMEVPSVHSSA